MITIHRTLRSSSLVLAGMAAIMGGSGAASAQGASPELQQQSWEIGCAYRSLPTGNGEAYRTYNCDRQKSCQELANQRGETVNSLGCFGIRPTGRTPSPAATRQRPTQQN